MSFVSLNSAYREMQKYSALTNKSLLVFGDFQELSRLIANAAVANPELLSSKNADLFLADSSTIFNELRKLTRDVSDSINIRTAKQADFLIRSELPWILKSNVPDSILQGKSQTHLNNLKRIDALIKKGISRTNYLFKYREEKLKASIGNVKMRIAILLIAGSVLLGYLSLNLFRQNAKRKQHEESLIRQEKELRKSETRFRETMQHMMEGVQLIDFKWRYLYVNDAVTAYSGFTREQMVGKTVQEIYPGVEASELYATLKKCMENRVGKHFETEFVFPNGTAKHFVLSVQPVPEGIFILSVDITERTKAQEDLEKNIQELADYKYGLDEASIVAITDQKGIIKHVNENFCKISKYSREELIGQDHRIINSGYHPKELIRNLWTTIANGQIWKGELKNKAKDGTAYWVDTTIIPFLNSAGKPYQYLAIRSDITQRKKNEEEIFKLNRLYALLSAINQSIVHTNTNEELLDRVCHVAVNIGGFKMARIDLLIDAGRIKTVNISGENQASNEKVRQHPIDYTSAPFRDTPMGRTLRSESWEVNNDLCNDPALSSLKETLSQMGIASSISLPIKRSGKMIGVFNISSSQVGFFDAREIDLVLEAASDISFALDNFERKRLHLHTEKLVESNEKRFRALIEKSTDMKVLTDKDGYFIYASPNLTDAFGYTQEEFIYHPAIQFFHPDDMKVHLERRKIILANPGSSTHFQFRIKHKDGRWIWCEGSFTNLLHDASINALVSNFRDITERKQAEAQKEFDNNNLQALINNTEDLSWSLGMDFKFISFNQPFCEVIKQTTGKELKRGESVFVAALTKEHEQRFRALYKRAFEGETFTVIDVVDEIYAAEISFYPIRKGGEIIGTACHSRDITARLKAEKEREKMMSDMVRYSKHLEQFAYVVSHNLRSPVAHILGLSNLLKAPISGADREKSQELLYRAVDQLDNTVKDLNKILEVRSEAGRNFESVDLAEVLDGVKISIRNRLEEENVLIENDFKLQYVYGIKSYIHSIFYNLITNSIKYRKAALRPVISIHSEQADGKIILIFRDNGMGMKLDQYGNKVFGLYQRFHVGIAGKGMGLFMVKAQVEALEGSITVSSTPGEGTEFRIILPINTAT